MPLPQLNVYRHDRQTRALITLAGEIDIGTAPLVRHTLEQCLHDGIRTIDIDLTPLTFCDCSGLNTFIEASQYSTSAGVTLRLHYPPPMLVRIIDVAGAGFLLSGPRAAVPSPRQDTHLAGASAPPPPPCFETLHRLAPAAVASVSDGAL